MGRSGTNPPRRGLLAVAGFALAAAMTGTGGCAPPLACNGGVDGMTCSPACPRDAERDSSGRCACVEGSFPVLGACVPAAVGDAFCAPATATVGGECAFRTCGPGDAVDLGTGRCVPRSGLGGAAASPAPCEDGRRIVDRGHPGCASADATCPRGARRGSGPTSLCARGPACPPGTLPDGDMCRAIVTTGGRTGERVDVGAWAALALGIDGGPGSSDLCRPLEQHVAAFELPPGQTVAVAIGVTLIIPDEDVSRLHADVAVDRIALAAPASTPADGQDGGPAPVERRAAGPNAAEVNALVTRSVDSMLEALRGLGGEASAAAIELHLRCTVTGT